ncbi:MAG: GTP-binding protein YchF [Candidatus Deianiraeaceae bacterium]|jgi:GTP-binding protein YchF
MGLTCGIVGLPNIGKSTLFNAISKSDIAESANYPFCTIEPNSAKVALNDERLRSLAKIARSGKIIPNYLDITDIAGLVKGASKGEGLGNKFLSHVREVDAIIHLVRCFEDEDITHVEGTVDPVRDIEIIETELILADLEQAEKMLQKHGKKAKSGEKLAKEICDTISPIIQILDEGNMLNTIADIELTSKLKKLNFITCKPLFYVCNIKDDDLNKINKFVKVAQEFAKDKGIKCVQICAQFEADIASIEEDEERKEFLESVGIVKSGLDEVTDIAFDALHLRTFYTVGPKEAHAWTFSAGITAPKCAGIIHTDFERGFIKAETISANDFIDLEGEAPCKEAGKCRMEGKDYIVQDGDIMNFKFNV